MTYALVAALLLGVAAPAVAVTIGNTPDGGTVGFFGAPPSFATATYGQVFTAPITGTLTSFTLYLDGGVGALQGGIGTWNGTTSYAEGFGSPTNLYLSAVQASVAGTGFTPYMFTTNISVTAGQAYVAYLTTFGVPDALGQARMPLANAAGNIHYFVFNNIGDPNGNNSWDYFNNFGSVRLDATFLASGAVPEPASWAMLITGFGLVGAARRRRRRGVAAA